MADICYRRSCISGSSGATSPGHPGPDPRGERCTGQWRVGPDVDHGAPVQGAAVLDRGAAGDMPYLLRSKAVSRPARSVFSPTAVAPTETPDFNELALFYVAVTRAERELHTNMLLESLPEPPVTDRPSDLFLRAFMDIAIPD